MMKNMPVYICMLFTMALSIGLGGCGIKPGTLEPPPGAEEGSFPAQYPSQDTEPDADNVRHVPGRHMHTGSP